MIDIIVTKKDLEKGMFVKNGAELWVDVGSCEDDYHREYGHFGASLTFCKNRQGEWEVFAITIADPKVHTVRRGEEDFKNYRIANARSARK